MSVTPGPDPAPAPTRLGLYVSNVGLLIAVGLLLSAWTLYFTDSFPVVGGLLGLGGFFAWIAFLSDVMRKERKEEMQQRFEEKVLLRHGTWLFAGAVLVLFALWAGGRGTVVVDAAEDSLGRTITITPVDAAGASPTHQEHLPARQSAKFLVPTRWFSARAYRVKASGLPATVVQAAPFRRLEISVPSSFLARPVVLVTLSPVLSGTIAGAAQVFDVSVLVDGKEAGRLEGYHGESLWIGADSEVAIPQASRDRWRLDMMKIDASADGLRAFDVALVRWTTTKAVAPDLVLRPGQALAVRVVRRADTFEVGHGEAVVHPLSGPQDFPQEIRIDLPAPRPATEAPHAPSS